MNVTKDKLLGRLVTPPYIDGGIRKSYPISIQNFFAKPPANYKGDRQYLIIGFDTEYQRIEVNNGSEETNYDNEILSYQYSCMVVDVNKKFSDQKWDGIIIPESPDKTDRLTVSEFVEFSIGHGIHEYPDINLPREIYLVAHFTRADIPGFKDFKDDTSKQRSNLNLENIRNTFINVKQDMGIVLHDHEDKTKLIKLYVKVRDTITLAPTGKGKLEDLGEVLDFKKIKLHKDENIELEFKRNMKSFMKNDWLKFREYAIRDSEICLRYTETMIHLYKEETDRFKLPITLTQIGVDLIRQYWKRISIDPLEIVGKKEIKEKYFSKKYNRYVSQKRIVSNKELFRETDFITECYHGGRNEQFWFGPTYKDIWYDYDLTSAYPSAMGLIGHPDWKSIKHLSKIEDVLFQKDHPDKYRYPADLVFAEVKFHFPEEVRFPCLPVRTGNGLIFPRTGNSTTHISEIILAHKLGAKLEFEYGVEINSQRFSRNKHYERPFREFTKICVDKRKEHPKNSLRNLFWKELVNSTYGKTAQGLRERRIYNLRDDETKRLNESKITNPAFASYITAFCRGALSEIMNNLPQNVDVFSVTTDGFLTTATPYEMNKATNGVLCKYYKSSRKFLSGEEKIYEVKHIIKQPLGWRTRGQSTITPSDKNDWELTSNKSDYKNESMRYVLAKGGIKLSHLLTKTEETREINKLFFDRTPNKQMDVKLGLGIRDMYTMGRDFVDRTMIKRLSMEYDWKRKPHYVGEVDINIKDIKCKRHVFFSTNPWESIDHFNKVRMYWEDYNKDKRHNIKSINDYNNFKDYLDGKLSIENSQSENDKIGTYIRKKNGLEHRIRQQIVIAHKFQKCGTHTLFHHAMNNKKILPNSKLKSEYLADCLSKLLSVDVSRFDVYNDKKKKGFTPHQIPNSTQSIKYLNQIREYLFPKLNIEEFLSKKGDFSIDGCCIQDCQFSRKLLKTKT
tara:strand:+ start:259 stop:3135 length:2877 start_codon:yes stop_codon:yes gene_type:complete